MRAVAILLTLALAAGGAAAEASVSPAHPAKRAKKKCQKRHGHKKKKCVKAGSRPHAPSPGRPATGPSTPAGAPSTPPAATGGQAQEPGTTPAPKPLGHLGVVAREFSMIPSRLSLAAGTVSVELNNRGEDPHDLRVERADSPGTGFDFALAKPSTVSSRKLDLAPGKWKLYCTLPGHDEAGMHAFVTVTP